MLPNTVTTPVWRRRLFYFLQCETGWKPLLNSNRFSSPARLSSLNENGKDLCLLQQQKSLLIAFLIWEALDSKINQSAFLNKPERLVRPRFGTQHVNFGALMSKRKLFTDVPKSKAPGPPFFLWLVFTLQCSHRYKDHNNPTFSA